MHPILFQFGGFKLHTYGLMMGLGFLTALQLILFRGVKLGFSELHLNRLIMIGFGFGIIGARLLYIIVDNPLAYLRNPLEIFAIWRGGLVFLGSFIGGTIAMAIYMRRHQLPFWRLMDTMAAPFALAHALGRIGCFMAGCCYGKVCHLPWAVTFTHPAGVGLKNLPLHPTQVYESLFLISLYFLLLLVRRWQRFDGAVTLIYLGVYAVGRSLLELLRSDMRGGLFGLSTAQWISIPMLLLAIALFTAKSRNRSKALTV